MSIAICVYIGPNPLRVRIEGFALAQEYSQHRLIFLHTTKQNQVEFEIVSAYWQKKVPITRLNVFNVRAMELHVFINPFNSIRISINTWNGIQ